ncbi:hypothetical protein PQX77_007388 [Marasmius sp. AFHP31]|nr:hypothetical protein PQX77_007388 [Marasmius sp. AFHP31]
MMRSATQKSTTSRAATSKEGPTDGPQCRWVMIKKVQFELSPSQVYKLSNKSPIFHIFFTSQGGRTASDPIRLSGHNIEQFQDLLWALQTDPLPDAVEIPLPRLLSVAELAFKYQFKPLGHWSMSGIRRLVSMPNNPKIRQAPDISLSRLLKLSILYQQHDLCSSLQSNWLTRVYRRELSPFAAITVGDKCALPHFLGHAMYVHMVEMACRIANCERIDLGSPLTHSQNLHIFCGYYSLQAYWRQIPQSPPTYPHSPECRSSQNCRAAWVKRWKASSSSEFSAFPDVDVLRRILELQRRLVADPVLKGSMPIGCRDRALDAVIQKRTEVSNNMHHHFDI